MLKGKRGVSACSLSSCRIRAEALARALNSRIWPCMWVDRESVADGDGMSNGEDEEMFFDASPSPVEDEEEALGRHNDSSAATEAGRSRLYQLLQQHATDDSAEVFYDVGEEVQLKDNNMLENCVCNCQSNCKRDDGATSGSIQNFDVHSQTLEDSKCDKDLCPNLSESILHPQTCLPAENHLLSEEIATKKDESENPLLGNRETQETTSEELIRNVVEVVLHNKVEEIAIHLGECNESREEPENNSFAEADTSPQSCEEEENVICIEVTEVSSLCPSERRPSPPPESENPSDSSPVSNRLQVFDEDRPRISRSTSLKTGKTPPGTPSRKKIVRFADVLGLDLEDVHHIMTSDLPNIPSSAYTDLVLADEDLPSISVSSNIVEVQKREPESWKCVQGSMGPNILYPLFQVPGHLPNFLDKVRTQGICLETVVVSDMNVQCTCRVMNWGFKKKVVARYTINNWASSNDIDASYVPGSNQGEMDNFAFNIFLSPLHRQVAFALRYVVNGREYWDNNELRNYHLGYHGDEHVASESDSMWHHQFW